MTTNVRSSHTRVACIVEQHKNFLYRLQVRSLYQDDFFKLTDARNIELQKFSNRFGNLLAVSAPENS